MIVCGTYIMKYNFYKMSETVVIGAVVRVKRPYAMMFRMYVT